MKKNVGYKDKIIRLLITMALAIVAYYFQLSLGNLVWIFYGVILILLVTVFTSRCPFYSAFNISTYKRKDK